MCFKVDNPEASKDVLPASASEECKRDCKAQLLYHRALPGPLSAIEQDSTNLKKDLRSTDPVGVILPLIVIGILVLAMIGLGWQTFFSGVAHGAQQVVDNSMVESAIGGAREYLGDFAKNSAERVTD